METSIRAAVDKAIAFMGSQRALARALGISAVAVGQWGRSDSSSRGVPPKQCVRVEQLTDGLVGRRELRPHDWRELWPELVVFEPKPAQVIAGKEPAAINSEAKEGAHV
jgi:DNA-binding transcriptional regulator YdaS (Cro superfamily)